MPKSSNKPLTLPRLIRVKQRSMAHCGPAVLEMLLSFLDIKIHQDAFVEAAEVQHKLSEHGMTINEMGMSVRRLVPQVIFWYKHNASITDIQTILHTHNHPVGVEWQGLFGKLSDDDNGHYSIVVKIDAENEKMIIADPFWKFFGKDRVVKISNFLDRWWDYNMVFTKGSKKARKVKDERTIFIITHSTETYPKSLGMHQIKKLPKKK